MTHTDSYLNTLTDEEIDAIQTHLDQVDKNINENLESLHEYEKESVNGGEYLYLLDEGIMQDDFQDELSEEIDEALDKSEITSKELFEYVIKEGMVKADYNDNSTLARSGGENCLFTQSWNHETEDQVCEIENVMYEMPEIVEFISRFASKKQWSEFLKRDDLSSFDNHLDDLFDLVNGTCIYFYETHNYDSVDYFIDDDYIEQIVEYLNNHPKKLKPYRKKSLVLSDEHEFRELSNDNMGYCPRCGELNYNFHEPDAENYHCDECETETSMGIEQALVHGLIEFED